MTSWRLPFHRTRPTQAVIAARVCLSARDGPAEDEGEVERGFEKEPCAQIADFGHGREEIGHEFQPYISVARLFSFAFLLKADWRPQQGETTGMKRSRFPEEQIIGILKEQEAGATTADVCRRHGVSGATFASGRPSTGAWRYRRPSA